MTSLSNAAAAFSQAELQLRVALSAESGYGLRLKFPPETLQGDQVSGTDFDDESLAGFPQDNVARSGCVTGAAVA